MKIIDLTYSLSEKTIPYPGKTPFQRKDFWSYEDGARVDDISLSSGIGTHMDAPIHFYREGKSIDEFPMEQCCGDAIVLHLADRVKDNADYAVSMDDINDWEKKNGPIPEKKIILVHTGWDRYWGQERFMLKWPFFSKDVADYFVKRKVNGLGVDTSNPDPRFANQAVVHQTLLKAGIFIAENLMNLSQLPAKGAMAYLLPMKLKGLPEAPIRAIAVL